MRAWAESRVTSASSHPEGAMFRLRASASVLVALSGVMGQVGIADAQTFSTTLTPVVAPDYSRDRNVSVLEEVHPDYDALGINVSNFTVFPSLLTGVGASNNVYDNDNNKRASSFVELQPTVFAKSNWSRHQLTIQVSDDSRRYPGESPRDQDSWYADVAGQVSLSEQLSVKMNVQAARYFESPFSSDASASDEVLSNYLRKYAGVDLIWAEGRMRWTVGANRSSLNFNSLRFADDITVNQTYRDRLYNVGYARSEYAISPSLSVYGQASFDRVSYDQKFSFGLPSRDSNGQQLIGGLSFDLAGLMRGNLGVGYTHRSFDAANYANISGFSAQGKLDFFLSPLTTFTLSGQRTLQDSSLGTASGYWDTRAQVEVDHSVRENVIVSPQIQYVHQSFVGLAGGRNFVAAGVTGKVQFNRRLGARVNMGYSHAGSYGSNGAAPFSELTGMVSVQYRI